MPHGGPDLPGYGDPPNDTELVVPRVGELTSGWRVVMVITWVAVVLAWSSVWNASVQLGDPTWWLGTRATPTSPLIRLAPFVGPVAVMLGTILNVRWIAWVGVAGALVFGAYAVADLGVALELGLIEVAISVAALAVSLAALTGTYRVGATGRAPGHRVPDR